MNLEFTNLNAVVCGSTQGIGLATAEVLAKLGANIYLLARNETKLKQISQRLDNTKGQVHNYLCIDIPIIPYRLANGLIYVLLLGSVHLS